MAALAPYVVTRRNIIESVAQRWRKSYPDNDPTYGPRSLAVREKLEALDLSKATVDEVKAAIGNDSWTNLDCDICESDRDAVVSVPRKYESPIAVCYHCAAGIAEMLAAVPASGIEAAPADETRSGSAEGESPANAVGDAHTPSGLKS